MSRRLIERRLGIFDALCMAAVGIFMPRDADPQRAALAARVWIKLNAVREQLEDQQKVLARVESAARRGRLQA